jgi:hypothetical protein
MAISINPLTFVITVPKADLTLIQSNPTEIRELNLNTFRLSLKDWEDSDGITFLKTHSHNTEATLSGITFARMIEIFDPYSITFEDGQYAVNLIGANSNVADKVNVNQVSVRSSNSAGLITVVAGSGVTAQDKEDIINGVWDEALVTHQGTGTTGEALEEATTGGGATPSQIADAVWDEPINTHVASGTTGLAMQRLLGMTLENHVEDDITRDANGNKTHSIIYCYNSAVNATTHDKVTGITAKYVVTGNFDANNRVTSFSVILQ